MTIHSLLDLNPDMESKLDFTKGNPKTAVLMSLDVLFIDEARPVCCGVFSAVPSPEPDVWALADCDASCCDDVAAAADSEGSAGEPMLKCSGLDPGIVAAEAWTFVVLSAVLATPEGVLEVFVDEGPLRVVELVPDAADTSSSSSAPSDSPSSSYSSQLSPQSSD